MLIKIVLYYNLGFNAVKLENSSIKHFNCLYFNSYGKVTGFYSILQLCKF